MRKSDKTRKIKEANIIAEQLWLNTEKQITNEGIFGSDDFDQELIIKMFDGLGKLKQDLHIVSDQTFIKYVKKVLNKFQGS